MNKVKKIVFSLLFLFVFATSAILFGCEQKDPVTEEVPSNIDSETSIDKTEPGEDDVPQTITVPEDIDEPKDDPVSFLATAFISRHSSLLIKAFDSVAIADCQAIVDAISDFDELELAVKELLAEEKLLVDSFEDKIGKLEEEIDTVKMLIGLLSDEASTFEADLKAARMAYNALTVEQQNFVNNYSNLLESESTSRVKNVITIIARVVDSGNPSVECIAEAMTAYEKLTNLEKARIVNFSDLLEAEVSVTAQLDQTLANVVVSFIDELDHETGDFFDKVVAARSAYNSLTAARQVLVVNLTALEEAENLILASEAFIDAVKLIPYNLELTDKSQIIHAREIYDVLPTKVAELFSIKVQLDVLQNAENAIAALEIILQQAIDQFEEENAYALGLTVDSIMIEDKAAVTLAVTSYESLSIAVQETLSEKKAHLDNLLGVIESVEDFLRRFSNILVLTEEEVTLSHKSIVDSAFLTYEFLSENAKTLLANEFAHLNIIKEKVTLLEVVDGFKAWHSNVLSSSVETIKFADKADLQEALHAYNRLDASAKALLVNEKELLDRLNTQMTFLERAAEFVYANLYVLSLTDEIETEET
ncbi:MAG: hypothetical protein FWD58_08005, partial [Firmicutes bacterium]|nr:hypothetical protein [Bacillota bacterium]